jgi:inhibitor of KinA sporulation pathway (predicted exonuclease)
MATALQIVGLPLEGDHHRPLDDALNIAPLLPFCSNAARTEVGCLASAFE